LADLVANDLPTSGHPSPAGRA